MNNYIEKTMNELITRMSDEALLFIVEMGDREITYNEFETEWRKNYGEKSIFKSGIK